MHAFISSSAGDLCECHATASGQISHAAAADKHPWPYCVVRHASMSHLLYVAPSVGVYQMDAKAASLDVQVPRLIDFDNKRSYFRSRARSHHEDRGHYGTLRITVRREHVFEDSFHQLRMKWVSLLLLASILPLSPHKASATLCIVAGLGSQAVITGCDHSIYRHVPPHGSRPEAVQKGQNKD